ncbi:MAG: hypothetical protein RLZ98_3716 [Pseudomonadota bacterium]|jgi:uncharacterized membrane protein
MAAAETDRSPLKRGSVVGFNLPAIAEIPADRPWYWLAEGYRDMWRAPSVSLLYGALFTLVAALMVWGLTIFGMQAMILSLCGGFLLLGPMLAVGLYESSRRIEAGEQPTLASALSAIGRAKGQLSFLGVILMVLYLAWVQFALILFMLFMGPVDLPPIEQFVHSLLMTPSGLGLLGVGTAVGAVLATTAFAISAVSIPLLLVERIDAMTAVLTSIKACIMNWKPMALWAILIAALVALGIVTLGLGLIFVFPLLGHATWHAFRDTIPEPSNR